MKKSRIQLALGFAFAFALCMMTSCEKEKPVATGKIQGIVTNSITGEPIKSVNISLPDFDNDSPFTRARECIPLD